MSFDFRLPDIGEGVIEGEVVRWLIKEGDPLREDQPMVEVMTDKATVEIPSPKAGRVARIMVPEGKICKVGQVMVTIELDGVAAHPVITAPPKPPGPPEPPQPPGPPGGMSRGKVLATPATRKLARDKGVDISLLRGTGRDGRVTRQDVLAALGGAREPVSPPGVELPPIAPAPPTRVEPGDEEIDFKGVRKKIAENMARSKQKAAHFTYVEECDATELVQLRERARKRIEERGVKLTYLPFIIKAVIAGLKKYPIVNSTLDEARGKIVLRKRYHIGVAAASEAGLIVPVVRDADRKSIADIARELVELSEKAKTGKATREELTGSTFTISSLGAIGGLLATPIINYPEVAVLGVHKIQQRPVVRDGQIVIRDMTNFSISLDHRIVDGYEGALFLQHVIALLSDPTALFMELA
ncbi:MAG TPA: dihydrolipoamide acetyltransferase family protein [Polyangia bacterium]|jgi:pyruvate dehydrogenase E2 component (dihydrolipoamide acetyltransferase)|nr:dihydrolipoamide acetyltransferase family protein [Polyangia bacterium]